MAGLGSGLATSARSTTWLQRALYGQDKLRQRMAWALAQIIVVSASGFTSQTLAECWLGYYDIFVRNAFGNFRDILQEVTYSPLMGKFLTHTGSSSCDFNGRYPNENYGREIMQLFTISLFKLKADGRAEVDQGGVEVHSYGNKQILAVARIFSGFDDHPSRGNLAGSTDSNSGLNEESNMVDPMQVVAGKHDVYPKRDLGRGYLGDGYPLCSTLPKDAFLAEGARYVPEPSATHDLTLQSTS